jgi:hypothetical protein
MDKFQHQPVLEVALTIYSNTNLGKLLSLYWSSFEKHDVTALISPSSVSLHYALYPRIYG